MLEDIRDAAEFILASTHGKTLTDYSGTRMLRQAIERNLEIIGGAVKRLEHGDPETAARISHAQNIIAFRAILAQGCDMIDDAQVWNIATRELPALLKDAETLLREIDSARQTTN